jgi:pimeloyl-ACP methyl ester carboxylesterase
MILRLLLLLPFFALAAVATPAPAPTDVYAPGRAVVAEIDKIVTPRGIDETFMATLGGARQVVNVRGADRNNPILIFVHGGPGAVEMPVAWAFQRPWEDYFTVVEWDQRGAGSSYLHVGTPVIFFLGRHDYTCPWLIAEAWMKKLSAPKKKVVWFENSAHLPMIEEPGRVFAALIEDVGPLTGGGD